MIGGGGEADTAGGRALSVFADLGIGEKTWLTGALATTLTGGAFGGLDTIYVDGGIDHWFGPLGVRLGAAYWGDDEILDSADLRGAAYFRNDAFSLALNLERRDFDFTFAPLPLADTRTVEFSANGFGLTTRLRMGKAADLYAGGMRYDFSRDINLQPRIELLNILSTSRLSLMNSLIDYRYNAGVEFHFGLQSIDFRFETWQTAVDQGLVRSIATGLLTPVGERTDMEFRLAYDDSENFGRTVSFAVYLYYFGG